MTLFDLTVGDMMNESILGRAQERDIIRIEAHQIRDYTLNKQKQVDDYPYGGGHGAVMQADPLYQCWKHIVDTFGPGHTIYMSPAGKTFVEADARRLRQRLEAGDVRSVTVIGASMVGIKIVELCREAGVTMTGAGATYPYGVDPADSNIRIAPSLPPVAELEQAAQVLCTCLRLAALEKLGV